MFCQPQFFRFFFLSFLRAPFETWKKERKLSRKVEPFHTKGRNVPASCIFYIHIFHHRIALLHGNCVEFEPERRHRRVRCDAVWRHLGAEFAHFDRNEKPNRKFTCNFYFSVRTVWPRVSRRESHRIRVLLNNVEVVSVCLHFVPQACALHLFFPCSHGHTHTRSPYIDTDTRRGAWWQWVRCGYRIYMCSGREYGLLMRIHAHTNTHATHPRSKIFKRIRSIFAPCMHDETSVERRTRDEKVARICSVCFFYRSISVHTNYNTTKV